MNKVYRVLWSQVKHAYVVVSEIAKNRTKHSRGIVNSHRSMAALCVVLLCSGVNVAEADVTVGGGNNADYTQKTQITGVNNTMTGTDGNIAKLNYVYGLKKYRYQCIQ